MDRRKFIASTVAIGAAGLFGSTLSQTSEANAKQSSEAHPDLTGVWTDPYLNQPSAIIIECNNSGSEVTVIGTYWHDDHGQSTFHGTGELKDDVLTINYNHKLNKDLADGVVSMKLAKVDNTYVLKGSAKKSDESWSCSNMNWYKERR